MVRAAPSIGAPRAAVAPAQPVDHGPDAELDLDDDASTPATGTAPPIADDDAPAPEIQLAPDLPVDAAVDDLDPLHAELDDEPALPASVLTAEIENVVGVKFAAAGKIYLFDAGPATYLRGEEVVVDSDRGVRLGTVAIASVRGPRPERQLKRILRRPSPADVASAAGIDERAAGALRSAKDAARELRLPLKVFRAEVASAGNRTLLYFTSEERVDFRELVRRVQQATGLRVELRQIGARDEAKMVGGIGSCGLTLCCTTWLPEFVPVSIKMAKDQGLVLNPSKVSGQCGRLKCCLVYEQATYAELRKGLPKLGKRVITPLGEGRVVEVDVLRQRIRVATGPGESQVYAAGEIQPLFPPQQRRGASDAEPDHEPESDDSPVDVADDEP